MLKTIGVERAENVTGREMDVREAEQIWASVRGAAGFRPNGKARLVSLPGSNPKMWAEWGLTLTAGSAEGLCVNDAACKATCVVDASFRGTETRTRAARSARATLLVENPAAFAAVFRRDALATVARGVLGGRPNVNSDVAWERVMPGLLAEIEEAGGYLYDYTKRIDRVGMVAPNYWTVFSATRSTREATIRRIVESDRNVACVFPVLKGDGTMPKVWRGMPVVDGDYSDDRTMDPRGVIVGLSAKGGVLTALVRQARREGREAEHLLLTPTR